MKPASKYTLVALTSAQTEYLWQLLADLEVTDAAVNEMVTKLRRKLDGRKGRFTAEATATTQTEVNTNDK